MNPFLERVFGGDTPADVLALHQIAARAAAVYVIGLAIVRLGKSRMIGQATVLDVILGFILGSLLSRGITGHASLSGTFVGSAVIVAIHWLFTAAGYRWHWFGSLIKGTTRLVIENGQIHSENLRRSHISLNDLREQLRMQGVEDVDGVGMAYKERNGQISVIPRKKSPQVVDVAVRDGVQTVRIELC